MLAYARALGVTYYAQNYASIIRQPLLYTPFHFTFVIDSNARERDWKRDHVHPLATIESQEIILATDRFLLWKLFLPAEAILGPVFNFLWNKTPLLIGT